MKRLFIAFLVAAAVVVATTGFVSRARPDATAAVPAFPGAEGFGTATPGGRGGRVCTVTNLNNAGPGSLRSCVDMAGPRYVVFRTGGTIVLETRLNVTNPFITIAGQTAPGGGITLRMDPVSPTDLGTMDVLTHDVVIRYLRFRPGNGTTGKDSDDALAIVNPGVSNVVVDHCSFSWAVDENVNTYDGTTDITISNSIIAEGLNNSGHPRGAHSKGLLAGGVGAHNVSIHHNLFVSNVDRNPQVSGVSVADVRNNVVYNYGTGSGVSSTVGEQFASLMRREVIARTGMLDLGSHPKTWDLLRMTRMPAVRLDCGYLSHPVDRLLLLDARLRSTIAHAVLAAVQRLYLPAEADPPTGTFTLSEGGWAAKP